MKKLLTDKRVWAAVLLAATIILAAAGVRVPANIVAAIEAVIAAIPSPEALTLAPSPVETGEGSADIVKPAPHDALEQPDPATAEGTPPPFAGEGTSDQSAFAGPSADRRPTTAPEAP